LNAFLKFVSSEKYNWYNSLLIANIFGRAASWASFIIYIGHFWIVPGPLRGQALDKEEIFKDAIAAA